MRRKVRLGGRVVNSSILLQVVMRTGVVIGSILRHGSSWDKGVGTGMGTSVWDSAWVTYITSTGACGRTRVEARDLLGNEASQGDSNGSGAGEAKETRVIRMYGAVVAKLCKHCPPPSRIDGQSAGCAEATVRRSMSVLPAPKRDNYLPSARDLKL